MRTLYIDLFSLPFSQRQHVECRNSSAVSLLGGGEISRKVYRDYVYRRMAPVGSLSDPILECCIRKPMRGQLN